MKTMMSPRFSLSKSAFAAGLSAVLLAAAPTGAHAQTTGFNQTGAGPFDYDTASNWVNSTINGVWDSTLALTAAQAVTFDSNLVLSSGLSFGYAGNFDLTLRGDGTNRTITLGGDISVSPVSNRSVIFGSATSGQYLDVNLGGNRTFTVSGAKTLGFYNNITGGNISLSGGGTLRFYRAGNAASSAISVAGGSNLYFDSTTAGVTGATRASSVTLGKGVLTVGGNSTANSIDAISNALTIDGASGFSSLVYVNPNASKNAQLTAGSLVRTNHGIAVFSGTNLGANTIASATANSGNISFATAPTGLVGGGGAAGTTTISILPWAIGGTSASDTGSTFVTYTADNGIRTLNTATEFASSVTDGATTSDNVRLTASAALTQTTTINSLIIAPTAATTISGGTLKITSGAILLNPGNTNVTTAISSNLDFGSAEGVIGASYNRAVQLNGNISGTGGLTLYNISQNSPNTSTVSFQLNSTGNTYTGDTNILGVVLLGSNNFLPYGTRTGNVNVSGFLRLPTFGGTTTINGLNGTGTVSYQNSAASGFALGDNNANGTFSGVIQNTSGTLNFSKIGTGTQILSGANTYNGTTTVSAGTLIINGSIGSTNAVTVAAGAHLGGSGTINGAVNVSGTLAPGNSPGNLTVNNNVTILDGGAVSMEIAGATVGTQYDRVTMTGASSVFSLNGTNNLALTLSYTPAVNALFFLLDNQGSSAITGIFEQLNGVTTDLSQGALFMVGGQQFRISYTGDVTTSSFTGGNDLVVQAVPEPSTWVLLTASLASVIVFRRNRKSC